LTWFFLLILTWLLVGIEGEAKPPLTSEQSEGLIVLALLIENPKSLIIYKKNKSSLSD
jgi:hypothetical protein